jgi:hypothetical protein
MKNPIEYFKSKTKSNPIKNVFQISFDKKMYKLYIFKYLADLLAP